MTDRKIEFNLSWNPELNILFLTVNYNIFYRRGYTWHLEDISMYVKCELLLNTKSQRKKTKKEEHHAHETLTSGPEINITGRKKFDFLLSKNS